MSLGLIRKDYKILFRQSFGTFLAQMLFILVVISANLGIMGYSVMAVGAAWYLLMNVCIAEQQSSALAYLISIPYSRLKIVISKYLSTLLIFVGITVFYGVLSELTQQLGLELFPRLSISVVGATFICYMLFVSITLPMYFFLSDMTVRLVSIGLILGVSFGIIIILKKVGVDAFAALPQWGMGAGLAIAGVGMVLSAIIMKLFFDKLEF